MDEKKIGEMVIRLFESKCKNYTATTIKIWVHEIKKMNLYFISEAIKRLIDSADDFPSIGKMSNEIEKIKERIAHNIFVCYS